MSVFVDRVYETTTTTGTGAITMAGAVLGYFTFATKLTNPSVVDYVIVDNATGDVEVGRGTWTTTLARDTVLSSSNAGALVNFAAGTKQVFVTAATVSIANLLAQNTFVAGTITTSQPQSITQTWNAAGVTFTGRLINIANTASAAASLIEDWQVGGVSVASLRKDSTLAVQDLWVGNITNTTASISIRGNPSGSGQYGLGYNNGLDATHLYTYATRKLVLGSRDFGGTYNARFTFDDAAGIQTWTHSEAINYVFGTTTGSQLGTGATQKIGFWGATAVVRPVGAAQAAVAGTAGAAYTATEQTLINDLKTLVNQLRADLVTVGLIKGAA